MSPHMDVLDFLCPLRLNPTRGLPHLCMERYHGRLRSTSISIFIDMDTKRSADGDKT